MRTAPPQPQQENAMRETVICCVIQKLRRMNLSQLREALSATTAILERDKRPPHAGQTVCDVHQSNKTDISKITP